MAIRLNLNHEIESAQKESRRDPLKLGMLFVGAIIFLMALWYVYRLERAHSVNSQFAALQAKAKTLSAQEKAAETRMKSMEATTTTADTLMSEIRGRFFWAPLLSDISTAVLPKNGEPPNIQITRFSGRIISDKTSSSVKVEINGIAAGENPRKIAGDFRERLKEAVNERFAHFAKDSNDLKNLANFQGNLIDGAPVSLNGRPLETVTFVIDLEFPASAPKPAAVPAPVKKRK